MPLEKPGEARPSDPSLNLLDSALHDGAVVLDAYARFATTLIGTLLFPSAALVPAKSLSRADRLAGWARVPHRGIIQVVLALLIGLLLGRRFSASRLPRAE